MQKIFEAELALFASAAVHTSQLLKSRGGIRVKGAAVEGRNLLPALCMCCCGLDVQQHIMLIRARKDCGIMMSDKQGTSEGTGGLTPGIVA